MSPPTAYTAQEILEAYKDDLAMNVLNQRRLLAKIIELEQEIAALKAATARNGIAAVADAEARSAAP